MFRSAGVVVFGRSWRCALEVPAVAGSGADGRAVVTGVDADWVLAMDFGTTATAAVVRIGDRIEPLTLDGAGRMPSSVFADEDSGVLSVGQAADNAAAWALECYEPTPKRRVDDPIVVLGDQDFTPVELIAAVFRVVLRQAVERFNGQPPAQVVLTHPVRWDLGRRQVLAEALALAALLPTSAASPVIFCHFNIT